MGGSGGRVLVLAVWVALSAARASAWDAHWMITAQTLNGLKRTDPALLARLQSERMVVTPLEDLLNRAFGPGCTWDLAKDRVFEGVGTGYKIFYAEKFRYFHQLNWAQGIALLTQEPLTTVNNLEALGRTVSPYDVLRVYSDEPDWQLDDDVPRLRGKGAASHSGGGVATRTLRHFWYRGENHFGVDFGLDQETERRMQLYYELSLVAFEVGVPYWGYRFLGNSLHYLQDLTQPFHVHAIEDGSMVNELEAAHAYLCDEMRKDGHEGTHCKPEDNLNAATILGGWSMGTYHLVYEEFARSLMERDEYSSKAWVADLLGEVQKSSPAPEVVQVGSGGLLDLTRTPDSEQKVILTLADEVGSQVYRVFGPKFKYDADACREQFDTQTMSYSLGYRMGSLSNDDQDILGKMNQHQVDAIPKLVWATHAVLGRAAAWGREYLSKAMASGELAQKTGVRRSLVEKYAERCRAQ